MQYFKYKGVWHLKTVRYVFFWHPPSNKAEWCASCRGCGHSDSLPRKTLSLTSESGERKWACSRSTVFCDCWFFLGASRDNRSLHLVLPLNSFSIPSYSFPELSCVYPGSLLSIAQIIPGQQLGRQQTQCLGVTWKMALLPVITSMFLKAALRQLVLCKTPY